MALENPLPELLMHDHICKEGAMVFPILQNMFSEDEFCSMSDAFDVPESMMQPCRIRQRYESSQWE